MKLSQLTSRDTTRDRDWDVYRPIFGGSCGGIGGGGSIGGGGGYYPSGSHGIFVLQNNLKLCVVCQNTVLSQDVSECSVLATVSFLVSSAARCPPATSKTANTSARKLEGSSAGRSPSGDDRVLEIVTSVTLTRTRWRSFMTWTRQMTMTCSRDGGLRPVFQGPGKGGSG